MFAESKIKPFENGERKFLRVLNVDGLSFEGEFLKVEKMFNGQMLWLKTFSGEEVGLYFDVIRDIKFQEK